MMEIVGIEDAGIEVAGKHETEVFHTGIEVGIGHGARVLEFTQDGIVEAAEISVGDDGFESTTAVIGYTMLLTRKPAEEVLRTVVERIFDEMVAEAEIGITFTVNKSWPLTIEDFTHEDMA